MLVAFENVYYQSIFMFVGGGGFRKSEYLLDFNLILRNILLKCCRGVVSNGGL